MKMEATMVELATIGNCRIFFTEFLFFEKNYNFTVWDFIVFSFRFLFPKYRGKSKGGK